VAPMAYTWKGVTTRLERIAIAINDTPKDSLLFVGNIDLNYDSSGYVKFMEANYGIVLYIVLRANTWIAVMSSLMNIELKR